MLANNHDSYSNGSYFLTYYVDNIMNYQILHNLLHLHKLINFHFLFLFDILYYLLQTVIFALDILHSNLPPTFLTLVLLLLHLHMYYLPCLSMNLYLINKTLLCIDALKNLHFLSRQIKIYLYISKSVLFLMV